MLPKNWNQITVEQFNELRSIQVEESVFEYNLDRLSLFIDDVEELTPKEVTQYIKELHWLNRDPHHKYTNKIGDYYALPLSEVTWGMFIDLENFAKDPDTSLLNIAGALYRKRIKDEWGHISYEPYNYNPKERGTEFISLPITSIYGKVLEWINRRNYLINDAYSNLFDGGSLSEEEMEDLTPEEKAEIRKEEAEQAKFSKWSYEVLTLTLAGDDITKMKDVLNLKLVFVLNMLSAMKLK